MTLSALLREAKIKAAELRAQAGPMDAAGNYAHPELIPLAERWAAEAQRLKGLIARGAQRRSA